MSVPVSNTDILIKRSVTTTAPSSLKAGELAFSYVSNTLFIGTSDGTGTLSIGGDGLQGLAQAAYDAANSASSYANTGINNAASASDYANTAINNAASASDYANTAINNAASASDYANTAINNAASASDYANTAINNAASASEYANSGITLAQAAFDASNGSATFANSSVGFITANTTGNQTIDGVLNISGDLNVTGNIIYTDVETIVSQNSLIKLANNNTTSDVVDIGFYGELNNGTGVVYTGLFRHAGDTGKDYYLFDGYNKADPDDTFVIDPTDASFRVSTLHANLISQKVESTVFLAGEGAPNGDGNAGYSFQNDGGYDTGMFSSADGKLEFYGNNDKVFGSNPSGFYTNVASKITSTDSSSAALTIDGYVPKGGAGYHDFLAVTNGGGGTNINKFFRLDSTGELQIINSAYSATLLNLDDAGSLTVSGNLKAALENNTSGNVAVFDTNTNEVLYTNVKITDNHIQLANGTVISDSGSSGLFVDSLNYADAGNIVFYNAGTKELTYSPLSDVVNSDRIANNANSWIVQTDGTLLAPNDGVISDINGSVIFGTNNDTTGAHANKISLGAYAGESGGLWDTISIGSRAGQTNQGDNTVAIGNRAGNSGQGYAAIAIGSGTGGDGGAGQTNQGARAVAIGERAGYDTQGQYSIAVGYAAGQTSQATNSIILNASGTALDTSVSGLFIDPIRNETTPSTGNLTYFNNSTKEVTYSNTLDGGSF